MSKRMIYLEHLEEGYYSLSKRKAAAHAEASFYCLTAQNQVSGVEMEVQGTFTETFCIVWDYTMTEQIERTWRERNEATDEGACGIAFLLITNLTEYNDIGRAYHLSGFDYYLGFKGAQEPFDKAAKLEVSGIRAAKKNSEITQRVKEKLDQTNVSDGDGLPTYVIVVEFSAPISQVVRK